MCQCSQHTIAVHLQTGPAEPGRPGQANPFLVAEIFITCWQLFNAWNKVKSWNAKPFERKGCSMGALCCGYLKTERRGKTCEQHNEVIYCLSLLLWSFHFSWPFLTSPSPPRWGQVVAVHVGCPDTWRPPTLSRAAAKRDAMWCVFFHGRLWKTPALWISLVQHRDQAHSISFAHTVPEEGAKTLIILFSKQIWVSRSQVLIQNDVL